VAAADGTVVWLNKINDDELDCLYRAAAFCLYPSRYEGFGLPIIEAFARGKAVIASSGGALRETMQNMDPCLDPTNEASWEDALAQWISDPELPAQYASRIKDSFSYATWADAAARILKLAGEAEVAPGTSVS
jgi:glycosyltransferase involved in cell wall biosynthesis